MGNYGVMTVGVHMAATWPHWPKQHGVILPRRRVYRSNMDDQLEDRLRSELSAEFKKIAAPAHLHRSKAAQRVKRSWRSSWMLSNRLASALAVVAVVLVGVAVWQSVAGGIFVAAIPALSSTTVPANDFVRFPGWSTALSFDHPPTWQLQTADDLTSPDDAYFDVLTDLSFATSPEATDRLYLLEDDDVYAEIRVLKPFSAETAPVFGTVAGYVRGLQNAPVTGRLPDLASNVELALGNHNGTLLETYPDRDFPSFRSSEMVLFESSDHAYQSAALVPGPRRDVIFFSGNRSDSNVTVTAFAAPGRGAWLAEQVGLVLNTVEDAPGQSEALLPYTGEFNYEFSHPVAWERVSHFIGQTFLLDVSSATDPADLPAVVLETRAQYLHDLPAVIFSVNAAEVGRDVILSDDQAIVTLFAQPLESATLSYALPFAPNFGALVAGHTPDSYQILVGPQALELGHFRGKLAIVALEQTVSIPPDTELEIGSTLPVTQVPPAEFVMIQAEDRDHLFNVVGMAAPGHGKQLANVLIELLISAEPIPR